MQKRTSVQLGTASIGSLAALLIFGRKNATNSNNCLSLELILAL